MMQSDVADILGGLPFAALLVGYDEKIVAANALAQSLFGQAIIARHHGIALRQPAVLQAIDAALLRRESSVVRQVLAGQVHELVHRVTVSAVAAGALCLFQDISDQEQAEQMRRDFVANVSHELRTPLTSVLGFIETLRGPARQDEVARDRFLAIMATEAERMNRLVRDLLQLSRVEAQERQRPTAREDLARLVQAAVQNLRPLAERSGVEIVLTGLDNPVPIYADADQMTQVVTNLVENAIKYGGAGKWIGLTLTREETPRGRLVRLEIADRGEGIDAVHLPRLAERFYRVDGHRNREKGGTGLGLAIVKHIAQRHRGRLVVDSVLGQGTRFAVILPAD
ncbi:MAG: two-component sensor histidine kinase [Candidatus Saccharibacteria bacterium]|nr:two-component sensor histidine kinase [Pseudorhodobacter sp.]